MRYWMLPVPIRYWMTVLDDGIKRYRYRMTVFSRYSISGILSLSLSRSHLRPVFLLPLPCFPDVRKSGSAECRKIAGSAECRNSEERRKNAAQRVKMSKKKSERGKYFEERVLDDDERMRGWEVF